MARGLGSCCWVGVMKGDFAIVPATVGYTERRNGRAIRAGNTDRSTEGNAAGRVRRQVAQRGLWRETGVPRDVSGHLRLGGPSHARRLWQLRSFHLREVGAGRVCRRLPRGAFWLGVQGQRRPARRRPEPTAPLPSPPQDAAAAHRVVIPHHPNPHQLSRHGNRAPRNPGGGVGPEREHLDKLRHAFHAPAEFRTNRTVEKATEETARLFYGIVEDMEQRLDDRKNGPEKLARYLNQIVFCLYAEDAGLLPNNLFTRILLEHNHAPATFDRAVRNLFEQMAEGGLFGADEVARFNGDLFAMVDTVELSGAALLLLYQACAEGLAQHRAVHLRHPVRAGAGRLQALPARGALHQRRGHHAGGGAGGHGAAAP